ncbi:MAG: hypothetical protein U1E70_06920 [Acetobacteraceae bacterium]
MMELTRRGGLISATVAALLHARRACALNAAETAAMLGIADPADFLKRKPEFLAVAPWSSGSERLWAACLADEGNGVTAALIQEDADGETRRIVAGPVEADVLTIDPFWTLNLLISPVHPLGADFPAFGVTVSNSYLSTGRSTWSESMSIFLREGSTLRLVFSGYVGAGSSDEVPCRRLQGGGEPCRDRWERKWIIKTAGPAAGGKPPALVVVERGSNKIVSRHTWRGDGYHPATFERLIRS